MIDQYYFQLVWLRYKKITRHHETEREYKLSTDIAESRIIRNILVINEIQRKTLRKRGRRKLLDQSYKKSLT